MLILIIITFLIDYLLSYFIPISFNNLNYFYPMLLIVLIVYLYNKIPRKKYFNTIFILGIIYDLILFCLIYLTKYNTITFNNLLYKFSHSIIINISYYFLLNIIINKKIVNKISKSFKK